MRAVVQTSYGPPVQITVQDIAAPALKPGHVRLRVHAVGFGFPDALMVAGKYQVKPEVPYTPGSEVAGVVTEVASDVNDIKPGARVLAMAGQGGLAEECIAPAHSIIPLPDSMNMAAAAGFLVNYGTTYHALVQRANIQPGETLLVLGAAGGVGLTAIEIGKALGARVLAAASTPEKLELAKKHGADAVFNYTQDTIKAKVMEFTGDKGIDVAYDPVGADFAEQVVRSMAWNGRYLVIGFAGGKIPAIPLNLPLLKGCSLVGVFWGAHTRKEPPVHAANLKALFELFESGKIKPHVTELAGLERFTEALEVLNTRRSTGKVVIRVASDN
ncbi:NADPH:quinone oxidoreductase family protein [Steroidobacter sp.]|uniref:NADPH:quinone oxidoreductase family protein n=1 Tax=Steroidobacter sp. TaxID=1978227 RepID=UPI001A5E9099|nr:NADPH:quinone oxidoreductase family protein [Steroidobacter sp.]MBL8269091.1 NADPH:quinone oxidoreductase family protein [Steroidobacter sp.]